MKYYFFLFILIATISCNDVSSEESKPSIAASENSNPNIPTDYWSYEDRDDQATGGIKMIPIETPSRTFKVWTKRVGNNPKN